MPVLSKRCVAGIVALSVSTLTLALALLPYLMGVHNALQRPRLDCKQETIPLYPTFRGARIRNLSDSDWIASREASTSTNLVLAAILNAHAHSIPALWSVYGPHFWDVVFINPKMTPTEQAELGMRGIKVLSCGDGFKVYDINYKCVAELINDFMKPMEDDPEDPHLATSSRWGELQGLLAFHADLWLSPLVFASGLDLQKLWVLQDADSACQRFSWSWAWWRHGAPIRQQAFFLAKALEELAAKDLAPNTRCECHAWADLFYIPRKAFATWAPAAQIVGSFRRSNYWFDTHEYLMMNEVAVHLLAQVSMRHGCAGGCQLQSMKCCGGTGAQLNASDMADAQCMCGHRVDLRDSNVLNKLAGMWKQ